MRWWRYVSILLVLNILANCGSHPEDRPTNEPGLFAPTVFFGSILVAVFTGIFVVRWYLRNRDPRVPNLPVSKTVMAPPADLPLVAGAKILATVVSKGYEVTAILFDLAQQGYLEVRDMPAGWGGREKHVQIIRTDAAPTKLEHFELLLLDAMFGETTEVTMSRSALNMGKVPSSIGQYVHEVLLKCGYVDGVKRTRRKQGMILASVICAVGLFMISLPIATTPLTVEDFFPFAIGTLITSVIVVMMGVWLLGRSINNVHGLTPRGAEAVAQWQAFRTYLQNIDAKQIAPGQLSTYLPYAATFGTLERLISAYKTSNEPLPPWYHPMAPDHPPAAGHPTATPPLLKDYARTFTDTIYHVTQSVYGTWA